MSRVTDADCDPHLALRPRPTAGPDLARLAAQARLDLAALAPPAAACVRPISHPSGQHVLDVATDPWGGGTVPAASVRGLRRGGPGGCDRVFARRVVLATGQDGGGAWTVPAMIVRALPSHTSAHSNGPIEFGQLARKHIGI